MLSWVRTRVRMAGDDRGSIVSALMFAVVIAAVLSLAALAAVQVHKSRATAKFAGQALIAVGDRVQLALDQVNTTSRDKTPLTRIDQAKRCSSERVCTTLTATDQSGRIALLVTASTPDGGTASRQAVLAQLPTSGIITGVDSVGRVQFVQDGGTGTDLWQVMDS